jgi:23S rRNA (adenine2503-C2)-methyltransferase
MNNLSPYRLLGMTPAELEAEIRAGYGKGRFHARALFRQVHRSGAVDPAALGEFHNNPKLASALAEEYRFAMPETESFAAGHNVRKFLVTLPDGTRTESVLLYMHSHATLCVSSQIGCARGCGFCRTGRMGLKRSLFPEEIVLQVFAARFILGTPARNIVFMGMGEPMDNLESVVRAIAVCSDKAGMAIPVSRITVSTAGHAEGIRRLSNLISSGRHEELYKVHLAVSLNAPNDSLRDSIMPINRTWPLAELKEALRGFPLHGKKDQVFLEYVLIPGVNDGEEHAVQLKEFMDGIRAQVNLIPCNPVDGQPYQRPVPDQITAFYFRLVELGLPVRIRDSKGSELSAGCGQLGG